MLIMTLSRICNIYLQLSNMVYMDRHNIQSRTSMDLFYIRYNLKE